MIQDWIFVGLSRTVTLYCLATPVPSEHQLRELKVESGELSGFYTIHTIRLGDTVVLSWPQRRDI